MNWLFISLIFAAPLYVWRFSIAGLPVNFLMLASFVVIFVGLLEVFYRKLSREFIIEIKNIPLVILVAVGIIGLASLISLLVFGISTQKIGQWVVLYLQPLIIFFLINFYSKRNKNFINQFKFAVYVFLFAAGLLAILQYVTLWTLPSGWWGNPDEPKRAIAVFAHPNAFALFVTPLLAWLIPDVMNKLIGLWNRAGNLKINLIYIFLWSIGLIGLFLSLSRGGWFAILAAAGLYALLSSNKKVLLSFLGVVIIITGVVFSIPNLRWRVLLPFHGEKSSLARLSLWDTGMKMIKDNPVLGKGISGFDNNWYKYNTDPNLDHYNFPHNIFLNFWVDLGLMGLIGFLIIFFRNTWQGFMLRKNPIALSLLLFTVAMVVHGLIDIPYLKNDLAMIFWMVLAMSII